MSGEYAIDTNVAIAHLEGDEAVTDRIRQTGRPLLPAPVAAELLFGAEKSARGRSNMERVAGLLRATTFAPCDVATCHAYARTKLALAKLGRPLPVNDLWIAACCIALDATLVTRDGHFDGVPGLSLERW